MRCNCNRTPCKCGGWEPKVPHRCPTFIIPNNSKVQQMCDNGTESKSDTPCPQVYFRLLEPATINAQGSFEAECASSWARVGMYIWLAPFGYVRITGVNGNTISYKNIDSDILIQIPAGHELIPVMPISSKVLADMLCEDCICDDEALTDDMRVLVCHENDIKGVRHE